MGVSPQNQDRVSYFFLPPRFFLFYFTVKEVVRSDISYNKIGVLYTPVLELFVRRDKSISSRERKRWSTIVTRRHSSHLQRRLSTSEVPRIGGVLIKVPIRCLDSRPLCKS